MTSFFLDKMMPSKRGVSLGLGVALSGIALLGISGVPRVNSIIGGEEAPEGAWGAYVSIRSPQSNESCGGTAIQDNLILTAAHCVYSDNCPDGKGTARGNNPVSPGQCTVDPSQIWIAKNNVRFNLSEVNMTLPDYNFGVAMQGDFVQAGVLDYIVHPDYQNGNRDPNAESLMSTGKDMAILILDPSTPIPGPYAKLATSPPKTGDKGTIVGMGSNNWYRRWKDGISTPYVPPRLFQVDVTVGQAGVAPCPVATANALSNDAVACQPSNVTSTYNKTYVAENGFNVMCPSGNGDTDLGMSIDPDYELCLIGDWFYDDQFQYPGSPNPMTRTGLGLKSSGAGDSGGPLFIGDTQYGITERGPGGGQFAMYSMMYNSIYARVDTNRKDFIDPVMAANPPVTAKGGPVASAGWRALGVLPAAAAGLMAGLVV